MNRWCVLGYLVSGLGWIAGASAESHLPAAHAECRATGDGELALYSYPQHEWLRVRYLRPDGGVEVPALLKIHHLMRSADGQEHAIQLHLIRLLDHLQDHFGADTVEVISGYRSPAYNADLEAQGRAVARDSRHMLGDAADIHLDEITEEALRDYARGVRCGGVGFYPANHFVHVDLGPIRHWGTPRGTRRFVGETPITWVTPQNYFRAGDVVTWVPTAPVPAPTAFQLQHFHRGHWRDSQRLAADTRQLRLVAGQLPYGKYRLHALGAAPTFSNEFYFKRQ